MPRTRPECLGFLLDYGVELSRRYLNSGPLLQHRAAQKHKRSRSGRPRASMTTSANSSSFHFLPNTLATRNSNRSRARILAESTKVTHLIDPDTIPNSGGLLGSSPQNPPSLGQPKTRKLVASEHSYLRLKFRPTLLISARKGCLSLQWAECPRR